MTFSNILLISCLSITSLTFIASNNYQGQWLQDKFVHELFFQNKHHGTFIDIGAHDGVTLSNSYFFEKELGWSGICIEPMIDVYNKLRSNRSCICINGCISNSTKEADFLQIICPNYVYTEMLSGLVDKYEAQHINRIRDEIASCGGSSEIIKVQCYLLTDLLDQYGIRNIDYLSIDTEGSELDILRTIDFNKTNIQVIEVENNYNDYRIRTLLLSKGFELVTTIRVDEIYYNPNYQDSALS